MNFIWPYVYMFNEQTQVSEKNPSGENAMGWSTLLTMYLVGFLYFFFSDQRSAKCLNVIDTKNEIDISWIHPYSVPEVLGFSGK